MLVGVDIGGTFTDLVLSQDGQLTIHKLPSTPDNPAQAMLDGLAAIVGGDVSRVSRVAHGSTVATNAILERKGARTALITTQGFRDVLLIGRQDRPVLYDLHPNLPAPLIPRDLSYEVPERLDHRGDVLVPLDLGALDDVLDLIDGQGVESVAVCLLYSYINPSHEQQIKARILARGRLAPWQVALSSEVLPEFREYERASTVALEATVRPVMAGYISQLEAQLPDNVGLRVMKSDGGVISAARVKEQAIQTALSGPAAGVIGAFEVARLAGFSEVITLDMGGTSTDVAICPGEPIRRPESQINGHPLRIRLLDIETIGAGGGSIARVDAGGALRVGPQSAGARPGPAVYGNGGDLPTVSDANAVLGRLDPAHFLGGGMALDVDAAWRVVGQLGDGLGISGVEAARGIIDVANVSIDRALRRVSVARGYDPRRFTLVAFGGAGPLHACEVAARLAIPRVLVPRHPGVLCALGLLVAEVVLDQAQSVVEPVTERSIERLSDRLETMLSLAKRDLIAEGVRSRSRRTYQTSLDMRYQGQAYELNVPMAGTVDISEAFHQAHEAAYGYALRDRRVEVVNLRVKGIGLVDHPALRREDPVPGASAADASLGQRGAADGQTLSLYDRERLLPGVRFDGPALVFQLDSTIYLPAGWSAWVDGYRNLILERH